MCAPDQLQQAISLLRRLELEAVESGHSARALKLELLVEDYEAEFARAAGPGLRVLTEPVG